MKILSAVVAALATAGLSSLALGVEFRSADIHNADDYPTVVAVRAMSDELSKLSGGKHRI